MGGERCAEARAGRRKPPGEVSLSLLGPPGSGEAEIPVRASGPSRHGLATFESGWMVLSLAVSRQNFNLVMLRVILVPQASSQQRDQPPSPPHMGRAPWMGQDGSGHLRGISGPWAKYPCSRHEADSMSLHGFIMERCLREPPLRKLTPERAWLPRLRLARMLHLLESTSQINHKGGCP